MLDVSYKLKEEFDFYKRESERCARSYSDWKNDEFNFLDNNYLWGVVIEGKSASPASFQTLNYLDLYYNRKTKLYFLNIDFSHWAHPDWKDSDYLTSLLQSLRVYVESVTRESLSTKNYPLSTFELSSEVDLFSDVSLKGLYHKFHIFVAGFCAAQISE